jgi:hypothetical protein
LIEENMYCWPGYWKTDLLPLHVRHWAKKTPPQELPSQFRVILETAEQLCLKTGFSSEDTETKWRYVEELTKLALRFGKMCSSDMLTELRPEFLNSEMHLVVAAAYTNSVTIVQGLMPQVLDLVLKGRHDFHKKIRCRPDLVFPHFKSAIFGCPMKVAATFGHTQIIETVLDAMIASPKIHEGDVVYFKYVCVGYAYNNEQTDLYLLLLSDRFTPWRPWEQEKDYFAQLSMHLATRMMEKHPSALMALRRDTKKKSKIVDKFKEFQESSPGHLERFPLRVPRYRVRHLGRRKWELVETGHLEPEKSDPVNELISSAYAGNATEFEHQMNSWELQHPSGTVGCGPWIKEVIRQAARRGDIQVVRMLLEKKDRFSPNTGAVARAAQYKNWDIVRLLVKEGYDVNEAEDEDWPAIVSAVKYENETMFHYLHDRGAVIDTARMRVQAGLAKTMGLESMLRLLLQAGMDVDSVAPQPIPELEECLLYRQRMDPSFNAAYHWIYGP